MTGYLLRRLGFYLVTLWAAVTANFFIPRLMPGDPVQLMVQRLGSSLTGVERRQLGQLFGVQDRAGLLSQYGRYWSQLLHGHLGTSTTYFPSSVASVIGSSLPWTICLVGTATVISFTLGTLLGIVVGWRRGSWIESLLPAATFFSAVPYFWIGLVVLTIFGVELHWLPIAGGYSPNQHIGWSTGFFGSALEHALLPAFTIVVSSVAGWMFGMRNMMVTTAGEDYVLVAQAKGLTDRRVMLAYAARNAILPNLANFAVALGFVVGGSIVTEIVFSYPGIGFVLFQAVANDDYPLMEGLFLVITVTVLLANLLADLGYLLLDPRTRSA